MRKDLGESVRVRLLVTVTVVDAVMDAVMDAIVIAIVARALRSRTPLGY